MAEFWWPLLWTLAGLPFISLAAKYNLLRKSSKDYAYYLESKALSISKLGVSKLGFFLAAGVALTLLLSVPPEKMAVALLIASICGTLLETTILIGRPHPTPAYVTSSLPCRGCANNNHDTCTNTRMLDSFESKFTSKDGLLRPICCCGFRISALRPMSA